MAGTKVAARILAALITSAAVAGVAFAHGDSEFRAPAYGMGTGMSSGMMGGQGMGPGMMGGQGMGPGMMGGQGMGPGMTGGQGMGPGMMGGQGMGSGMMGGQGMGPGPMYGLDLNGDQRKQIAGIRSGLRKQHWGLHGQMMDARDELFELYADETPDPKKIGAVYGKIFDLRRQMIESAIDARNRQRAMLTAEQREQLRENAHGQEGGYGPGPGMMHHGFGHHMMGG